MTGVPLAEGVDPTLVSPGVGAFWALLALALVIILIARSFTVHMRRIQARAAEQAEADRQAQEDPQEGEEPIDGAPSSPDEPPREGGTP
ncbi:hypothetical protein IM660_14710 [Ruania alkalisoli]|uniref:Uncharacterized protein n=1 Tax=Ruania alkalisoli TaxID=2779775 RepID=A0A7M1SQN2_9MICO|nr:hypothetical protein [Ruania alkalisoli]QOR69888.1 hypothetical protein IM660_14710 [Ruania alkalisoli]